MTSYNGRWRQRGKQFIALTDASHATPIVITSNGHGLATGQKVQIEGVAGNTAANGTWLITRLDADTFSLTGSVGNGDYTTGGTWSAAWFFVAGVSRVGWSITGLATATTYDGQVQAVNGSGRGSWSLIVSEATL